MIVTDRFLQCVLLNRLCAAFAECRPMFVISIFREFLRVFGQESSRLTQLLVKNLSSERSIFHFIVLLGHITCIAYMRPIATDVARSVVCLRVCLCVGRTDVLCKNGWTDRDAVRGLTRVGPKNHMLDCGRDPPREGAILGSFPAHWKALESAAVYAAKEIIQFPITAWQPIAILPTGRYHITLSPVKNPPLPAMRPFVKIICALVIIIIVTHEVTRLNIAV